MPDLVIFSPLPPEKSGIADYCMEQLPYLARHWSSIAVVTLRGAPPAQPLPDGVEVMSLSEWRSREAHDPAKARLYHIGNNPYHEFVVNEALRKPGVVVLHDFCLHHLVTESTLARKDVSPYESLLGNEFGELGRHVARLRLRGMYDDLLSFFLPLNGFVLEAALGVIVHSRWAQRRIEIAHPGMPTAMIRHHFALPSVCASAMTKHDARTRLGLPQDTLIFSCLGFITAPKQVDLVIQSLSRLQKTLPPFLLCLLGEPQDPEGLRARLRAAGLQGCTRTTGYVSADFFHDFIVASDIIVNLRYPTAGETSGTLIRALGAGRSVVVLDYGPFADYPDEIVAKVPTDLRDTTQLENALVRLATDHDYRTKLESEAKRYTESAHDIGKCCEAYSAFIRTTSSRSDLKRRGWDGRRKARSFISSISAYVPRHEIETDLRRYLDYVSDVATSRYFRDHWERYVRTLSRIPVARGHMSALEIGSGVMAHVLRELLGYERVAGTAWCPGFPIGPIGQGEDAFGREEPIELHNCDVERYPLPFEAESFDLVLCCEVLEHLRHDPMFLMSEINRTLKHDGMLILSTPNIVSNRALGKILAGYSPLLYSYYRRDGSTDRHNVEYDPHQVSALVRAGGFHISEIGTWDSWSQPSLLAALVLRLFGSYDKKLRGDNVYCIALKWTSFIDRFPAEIYVNSSVPGPFAAHSGSILRADKNASHSGSLS